MRRSANISWNEERRLSWADAAASMPEAEPACKSCTACLMTVIHDGHFNLLILLRHHYAVALYVHASLEAPNNVVCEQILQASEFQEMKFCGQHWWYLDHYIRNLRHEHKMQVEGHLGGQDEARKR